MIQLVLFNSRRQVVLIEEFATRREFMNHRKHNHIENEPVSCWFKHSDTISENPNVNRIENDNND